MRAMSSAAFPKLGAVATAAAEEGRDGVEDLGVTTIRDTLCMSCGENGDTQVTPRGVRRACRAPCKTH